jgi:hypothetical protein
MAAAAVFPGAGKALKGAKYLDEAADAGPVLKGLYTISAKQKKANVGFRYQEYVTGTDVEQWWKHNGGLIKVDGGPDEYGFITEAKWAGPATPGGWNGSRYNPLVEDTVFNESTAIDQAQRLLG